MIILKVYKNSNKLNVEHFGVHSLASLEAWLLDMIMRILEEDISKKEQEEEDDDYESYTHSPGCSQVQYARFFLVHSGLIT